MNSLFTNSISTTLWSKMEVNVVRNTTAIWLSEVRFGGKHVPAKCDPIVESMNLSGAQPFKRRKRFLFPDATRCLKL